MEDFLLNTLNGIKQWATKFWTKEDEVTYSEWALYDAGTQAIGKTIITPIYGNYKKVTLVITSCGTLDGWTDIHYRIPYFANTGCGEWHGNYNGIDFKVILQIDNGQPVFTVNHLVGGVVSPWEPNQTIAFSIDYVTIVTPAV